MMRIVFVNLHANEMLVKTSTKYLFKQSIAIKHKYLLDYLLRQSDVEVCSYINDRGFSLMHNGSEVILRILNLFRFAEHRIILRKNGINQKRIQILRSVKEIKEDDIVIVYRHHAEQFRGLEKIPAYKVVSMIHYSGEQYDADAIEAYNPDCLMGESNLQKNSETFKRYYSFYHKDWLIHPFVFAPRFENRKPFAERKNMVHATGTITYRPENKDFMDVFHNPCVQPLRKQIKDNSEYFKDTIFCTSSDYMEDAAADLKNITQKDNVISALYKRIYNRFHTGQQKKYYSFNMVDAFNDYKMCMVGEEVVGQPGIGFVEGMACGGAYIGLDSDMYKDVGLYPGIHYIAYDGTIENLRETIEHYQKPENQVELSHIAQAGTEYVRSHFNGDSVARYIVDRLIEKQQLWMKGKEVHNV